MTQILDRAPDVETVQAPEAPVVATAVPTDEEIREIRRRLNHLTVKDLRVRSKEHGLTTHGKVKFELISQIVAQQTGVTLPDDSVAARPEIPAEDASREELEATITAENEYFRGRLQYTRDWAVNARRKGTARYCSSGLDTFLTNFRLPARDARDTQVKLKKDEHLPLEDYTEIGLRHLLDAQRAKHDGVIEKIREYGINQALSYVAVADLNRVFKAIGAKPYETMHQVTVQLNVSWRQPQRVTGDANRASIELKAKLEALIRETVTTSDITNLDISRSQVYYQTIYA